MNNFASDENISAPVVSKPLSEGMRGHAEQVSAERLPPGQVQMAEEDDLIRACQQGDVEAFDQLILRYQDQVFGLAFQLLHDREEAEDMAQEVFLSCYRNINSFRFESRFGTWLYRVTVNRVKNRWKYNQRRLSEKHVSLDAPLSEDDDRTMEIPDTRSNPRQTAEGKQTMELVQQAWKTLPLEYQEVLSLRFVQNLQYEEIAEALQCSLGTVKSRINRARTQLREKLGDALD